jgi:D-glycero-D-manno-heptose 1,7-bisphosphate phosphatase
MPTRAVFLDRDGVLIQDNGLLTRLGDVRLIQGVSRALGQLKARGFLLIVVSNQAAVARGLLSEQDVKELQAEISRMLIKAGAPTFDGFYFCPHHPQATLSAYRTVCECRKPRPGLLLRASREHDVSLLESFMIGDRITDIVAGMRAGCRTILVESGAHEEPVIETFEAIDVTVQPDLRCTSIVEAVAWILQIS